jgi:polysaccharide biosynthesis protein PslG
MISLGLPRSLLVCLLSSSLLAVHGAAAEQGLPPLVCPAGVGVNIHFTRGHQQDLDLIAAAGFQFVRMDFSWSGTERSPGQYDWEAYDELTANLEQRGLRALYILDYSNALYEDKLISRDPISGREVTGIAAPRKPESVAAFARWAGAAAAHYRGRGILWEIWNEPNIGFWKPQPNVADYTALALATCQAIRQADPQSLILAPASSGFPWDFFESLFQSGLLQHLDAVSVHPYRSYSQGPETAAADYRRLRALIQRDAPADKQQLPIVSGEWGYATHTKGVSLETQAAFIARQQLANLYHGVPLSIWYDWKNDGTDPEYNEHNFGTVTHDLQPKPSYRAVQTLTRQFRGCRIARRLTTDDPAAWVLLGVDAEGNQKLAAWTTADPATIRLPLGLTAADALSAVDGQGEPLTVQVEQGCLKIDLARSPQYLTFRRPTAVLQAAAAWQIEPLRTRVAASSEQPLSLAVRAANPFGQPCRVRLTLESAHTSDSVRLDLAPGDVAVHRFVFSLARRDDESPVFTVQVAYYDVSGPEEALVGQSEQQVSLVLANPLRLTVSPVATGLRVAVADPAGSGFAGTAVINGTRTPLDIAAGAGDVALQVAAAGDQRKVTVELRDHQARVVIPPAAIRFEPLAVSRYRAVLDGDAQVPATAALTETASPAEGDQSAAPFPNAWRLDYEFASGWRFARCVAAAGRPKIAGRPAALGVWVRGDGSGNALRIRVTDDSGQTFQPNGPNLDWSGWRWVTFDLVHLDRAGRWGGADDGCVHGELHLDTVLLVDSTRTKTAGSVYFAAPTLLYAAEPAG